jgi:hypothetical protein
MRYFHGTVRGSGAQSANSGTMSSGLRVEAMSKQGTVRVQLHERSGVDVARVWLAANPKTGGGREVLLYEGPVAGPAGEPANQGTITFPSRSTRHAMRPDPSTLAGDGLDLDGLDPMPERDGAWFATAKLRLPEGYDPDAGFEPTRQVGKLDCLPGVDD